MIAPSPLIHHTHYLRRGIATMASSNFAPRGVGVVIEQMECAALRSVQSVRASANKHSCLFRSRDRYRIRLKRACEPIALGVRRL